MDARADGHDFRYGKTQLLFLDRALFSIVLEHSVNIFTARPFMILAKASLGLEPVLSPFGNPLSEDYIPVSPDHRGGDNNVAKVECLLQLIMGLQNDILGKDTSSCGSLGICFGGVADQERIFRLGARHQNLQHT